MFCTSFAMQHVYNTDEDFRGPVNRWVWGSEVCSFGAWVWDVW
jgi:hypothetical protein